MTDPVSLGIAGAATVVAIVAGWLQWPRPPELDGERWFKMCLSTLLRGQIEAEDGTVEQWEELVLRWVPYHPAGRFPERKVVQPMAEVPGARLHGEQALQEALAKIEDMPGRWARMYDIDPMAIEARLSDPIDLGPSYDPAAVVGQGASWDGLAEWSSGKTDFRDALLRRLNVRWVLIGGRPDRLCGPSLLDAMAEELPDPIRIPWVEGGVDALAVRLHAVINATITEGNERFLLVGEEAGMTIAMRTMASDAPLRDHVLGVVSIGGVIGGREGEAGPFGERDAMDWLGHWFTQEKLDSELVRLNPWMSVQWLDRASATPGAAGLSLQAQRFPPPADEGVMTTVETVDLGPLPASDELPVHHVARALIATAGLWTLTRR